MLVAVYSCYGLLVASEINVPEFSPSEVQNAMADVIVQFGQVDLEDLTIRGAGLSIRVTSDRAIFFWDRLGGYAVTGGKKIVIDPLAGVEEALLRLPLLGIAFGALLAQRGYSVLHGSAVSVRGRAVGFVANKGFGKSTIAAAMHRAGHLLLTDDVAAIQYDEDLDQYSVLPAFPHLKIWPDIVAQLGHEPENVPSLHSLVQEKSFPVTRGFAADPAPLERLYLLDWGEKTTVETIPAPRSFFEIIPHSYEHRYLAADARTGGYLLRSYGPMVKHVPVRRLIRRRSLEDLDEAIRLVEEDLSGSPPRVL